MTDDEQIALALELLERLEHESLSIAELVDRIETITSDPHRTRTILDEAERRGIIEREEGVVRPIQRGYVRFQSEVVTKEGDFSCRRCGASLKTGYFLSLESEEFGPFGSSCIRRVTGRE